MTASRSPAPGRRRSGSGAGGSALWVVERPLEARLRVLRTLVGRHRRLIAAVCAGTAVLTTVSAVTAPPAPGDAAAGSMRNASMAAELPAGAGTRSVAGAARVAVTVRLGDPAGLLLLRTGSHVEVVGGVPTGTTATGVDAAAGRARSDGSDGSDGASSDTWTGADGAEVLADDAVVLAVPQFPTAADAVPGLLDAAPGSGTASSGGLDGVVVLAVAPGAAHRLAAAAGIRPLSVMVALPHD